MPSALRFGTSNTRPNPPLATDWWTTSSTSATSWIEPTALQTARDESARHSATPQSHPVLVRPNHPPVTPPPPPDSVAAKEPSSGRGNAKRATLSGTSDSDSHQHLRRVGRDRLDRRQVPPRNFHAAEHNDSDAPPFPPRISRHREHAQRLPPRVVDFSREDAPGADSPPSLQHMVEAVTAAAIAAVDRHLAHMGLYPRSEPGSSQDFMNHARPLVAPASVATPPPPAGSMIPTTHPAAVSTDNAYPFVTTASVATPPPLTGSVAPTTHPTVVSTNDAYHVVTPAPVSAPLPRADSVASTANPAPAPSRIAPPTLRPHSRLL